MNTALALEDRSLPPAAPLNFTIPMAELEEFTALPTARRNEVLFTLRVLEQLHHAIPQLGKLAARATSRTSRPWGATKAIRRF